MSGPPPTVSIGLPVFNGENFLAEAVESLLCQTFDDVELIISDNASTDGTADICREFAERDPRVRYVRNPENLGASANYTRVFEESRGRYFKWSAHDDVYEPEFLERCVAVLEAEPDVVLCHSRTVIIRSDGTPKKEWSFAGTFDSPLPHERFEAAMGLGKMCLVWGVMRRDAVARTGLLGNFTGHDRPFISAMSTLGRFVEVPDPLFRLREHPERSIRAYPWRKPHEAIEWYDPNKKGRITFPAWRILREHTAGVLRAELPTGETARCLLQVARWGFRKRRTLGRDLRIAARWWWNGGPDRA